MTRVSIPGQRATAILEEKGKAIFARVEERAMAWLLDGTFPGSKTLPAAERWQQYLDKTDSLDLALLLDEDYLQQYQDGLALAPVSPLWLAAISIPSLYKKLRRDFVNLYEENR